MGGDTVKSIESRLDRLEKTKSDPFLDVRQWIADKRCYSDLSPSERERYALYLGVDRQAMEDVLLAATGSLNDPLEKRSPKPTAAKINSIIDQLEIQILQNERNDNHV